MYKAWGTAGPMNSKVDQKYNPEVEDFPSTSLLSLKTKPVGSVPTSPSSEESGHSSTTVKKLKPERPKRILWLTAP